ncbi:MAG: DUF7710 domain-containing protein [Thermoguttaceae bacterium]
MTNIFDLAIISMMTSEATDWIWVVTGGGIFPCACFSSLEKAEDWIRVNSVTCTVTQYPLNKSLYDYALSKGYFKPKKEYQFLPKFKAKFSSASAEHYHYEFNDETGDVICWHG